MTPEQGPERPDDLPVDEGQAGNADGPSPESSEGAQATEDKQRGPVSRLVRNKRFVKLVREAVGTKAVELAYEEIRDLIKRRREARAKKEEKKPEGAKHE